MRELLDALTALPDRPRAFSGIEDALAWPRRRIASAIGGWHLRTTGFRSRRPYRLLDEQFKIRPLGDVERQIGRGVPNRRDEDPQLS